VLVGEDQAVNVHAIYAVLASDYEVLVATDGEQGLQQCRSMAPDLVLLDVNLPRIDGYEVCRQLQADPATRAIPVMFLTARADTASEVAGFALGAVDYISKPINGTILRARVKSQVTIKRQRDALRALLLTDALTGVSNRRHFDHQRRHRWTHCLRSGSSLALLMIDIDYFKLYNDHYGHQQGDACLAAVAQCCASVVQRPLVTFARYGGEEFAAILSDTTAAGAAALAQRMVTLVRALQRAHAASPLGGLLSISVGAACDRPSPQRECTQLLQQADAHLYRAKQGGRNQAWPPQ
jgi:diguanylate cyclase (GGDEF)-like protein